MLQSCAKAKILIFIFASLAPHSLFGQDKKLVVTTTFLGDLVREIAQGKITPVTLMGPGVDPHLYQMTPRDSKEIRSASRVLFHGLHLEGRMDEMLRKLPNTTAVAEVIPREHLKQVEANTFDPHVWFDVNLWMIVGENVKNILIDEYGSQDFEASWDEYKRKLQELNTEVASCISSIPDEKKVLITAHDAFSYFGKAYGIEVIGVQGISTESEVGLTGVMNVVKVLVGRKIPSVFIESTISRKSIDALLEGALRQGHLVQLGGELYSDALGDEKSGASTYLSMIKKNAITISKALGGRCS